MDELFRERYRLNDEYHNRKEHAIWLVATLYLGFAGSSVSWLLLNRPSWSPWRPYIIGFSFLLLLFVLLYLYYQNWNRARSVRITEQMDELLESLLKSTLQPADLRKALRFPDRMTPFKDKWSVYWSFGRMGNTVATVVLLFGETQILIVSFCDEPPPSLLALPIGISLLLLLCATSLFGRRHNKG